MAIYILFRLKGKRAPALILQQFEVLLEGFTLALDHLLVDLEYFVWLATKFELLEAECRFYKHEDGHFGLEWESVTR